ncbi:MAG: electron transporter RnfG [Bacteroidales bacterium 43_8]|nr:MAG: electron transporter RnfG [Bacteroidales bacterium 43_8]
MLWSLTLITAVAGGLLGYTHRLTQEPIARATKAGREKAIQQVIPKYDNSPIDEQCSYTVAKKEGILVGAAVECSNSTGYGGEIRIIVGFEADGTIRDYRVLKHQETPGLGAKMDEWFRTEKNNQNIIGKSPVRNKLQVKQDSGDIDAITAATITSRAFLAAIQTAYTAYAESMKGGNHE